MKKILSIILALTLLLSPLNFLTKPVSAATSGDYEYVTYGTSAEIVAYTGSGGDLYIPATFGVYTVTSIGYSAFDGCMDITSVSIPNTVINIGSSAFSGCSGLTDVSIPYSVNYIQESAFSGCTALTTIYIPYSVESIENWVFDNCESLTQINVDANNADYSSVDGVLFDKNKTTLIQYPAGKSGTYSIPDTVSTIGDSAFYYCEGLTSVTIPDSVTVIADYAFSNCTGLTSVSIPNSVISLGYSAFSNCVGLTSLSIPYGVDVIGDSAFYGCTGLTSVNIPSSVTVIDSWAFDSCVSLTQINVDANNMVYSSIGGVLFDKNKSTLILYPAGKTGSYTIPNGVTTIGDSAFYYCEGLTGVTIPSSVTAISDNAFSSCTALTGVSIPNSVLSIGSAAFSNCAGLTSVSIPSSVIFIDNWAFDNCETLTQISVDANNMEYSSLDGVLFDKNKTMIILHPAGKAGSYTIPNSVQTIGDSAFYYCTGLTEVTIPNSVTVITDYAFANCIGLTDVNIPASVTSIGYAAFSSCVNLTGAYFYGNAPEISYGLFDDCSMDFTVYYLAGKTGFAFSEWQDYPTAVFAAGYTVNFNSQSGSAVASKTADYNTSITAPTAPTRTGYAFGGWYKEAGCTNVWNFTTDKVTANITLFAKWTINTYTVTFNSSSGSAVASKTATYNNVVAAPANPTRTGYIFAGWFTSTAYATPWVFATNKVTANTTLYAKWIASQVTGLIVAPVNYNSLKISWTATPGANYYEVYRASSLGGTYYILTTQSATLSTTYTTTGLGTGTTYYFKVRAYSLNGTTKIYNNYSAIVSNKPLPSAPTGLVSSAASYSSTKLSWTAVAGANGYSVYRATTLTGSYSLIATVTTNTYTITALTTGATYYYKVNAYRLVGTTKVYGSQCAAIGAKAVPSTPTSLGLSSPSYNSLKLTWAGVYGANGYSVYRATSPTGTYTLLATVTTNSYSNINLVPGTSYYYKVNAYRLVGTTKVYGSQCAAAGRKVVPATIITLTAVRYSATSIKLNWGAISGASGYEIYRSTSATGTYTLLTTLTAISYINTSLVTGTTYYYKVRAYRLVGTTKVYADFSAVKYAKP